MMYIGDRVKIKCKDSSYIKGTVTGSRFGKILVILDNSETKFEFEFNESILEKDYE